MQKIFKTGTIFWEKAHCACAVVKTATQKALFYSHTTAEKAMDQSETLAITLSFEKILEWTNL